MNREDSRRVKTDGGGDLNEINKIATIKRVYGQQCEQKKMKGDAGV